MEVGMDVGRTPHHRNGPSKVSRLAGKSFEGLEMRLRFLDKLHLTPPRLRTFKRRVSA